MSIKLMDCPICKELIDPDINIIITQCKHKFHSDCLINWIFIKDNCPICRNKLYKPKINNDRECDRILAGFTYCILLIVSFGWCLMYICIRKN